MVNNWCIGKSAWSVLCWRIPQTRCPSSYIHDRFRKYAGWSSKVVWYPPPEQPASSNGGRRFSRLPPSCLDHCIRRRRQWSNPLHHTYEWATHFTVDCLHVNCVQWSNSVVPSSAVSLALSRLFPAKTKSGEHSTFLRRFFFIFFFSLHNIWHCIMLTKCCLFPFLGNIAVDLQWESYPREYFHVVTFSFSLFFLNLFYSIIIVSFFFGGRRSFVAAIFGRSCLWQCNRNFFLVFDGGGENVPGFEFYFRLLLPRSERRPAMGIYLNYVLFYCYHPM